MDDPQAKLYLNRVPHHLSMILAQVRLAPMIEVNVQDLHPLPHCGGPAETLVEHRPETPEATEREIVLFKQNGGYTILLGRKKWEQQVLKPVTEAEAQEKAQKPSIIRARLLSTPALKKCRLGYSEVNDEGQMERVNPVDRAGRTYHRDDGYRGNRMEIPRQRQWGR